MRFGFVKIFSVGLAEGRIGGSRKFVNSIAISENPPYFNGFPEIRASEVALETAISGGRESALFRRSGLARMLRLGPTR